MLGSTSVPDLTGPKWESGPEVERQETPECTSHFVVCVQGLEGGKESRADRYGDMARLGGTCGHLLRESPPAELDHSPVPVPLLEPTSAHARPGPHISLSEPPHCPSLHPMHPDSSEMAFCASG